VFQILGHCNLRIDATIIAKRAVPLVLLDGQALYRFAWHPGDRLLAVASDLGTRKRRGAFHLAVDDAVRTSARCSHRVAFWPNMSEPCLVVADYCTWAIQRKWERSDGRSYALIANKIRSEAEAQPPSGSSEKG
jgi:hypothetical protein